MHIVPRVAFWALISAALGMTCNQAPTPTPLFFLGAVLVWSCAVPLTRACVAACIDFPGPYHDACLYAVFYGTVFVGTLFGGINVLAKMLICSSGILVLLKFTELRDGSWLENITGGTSLAFLFIASLWCGREVALALFGTEFSRHVCLLGRLSPDDRVRGTVNCVSFLLWATFRVGVLGLIGITQSMPILLCYQIYEVVFFPVLFMSYMDM